MTNVLSFALPPKQPRKRRIDTTDPHWLADALNMRDEEGRPRELPADKEKR